jgi:hypothetical protein
MLGKDFCGCRENLGFSFFTYVGARRHQHSNNKLTGRSVIIIGLKIILSSGWGAMAGELNKIKVKILILQSLN